MNSSPTPVQRECGRNFIPTSYAQFIRTPFDHSELAYWMPRDPISAAYVNRWLNLLNLSGERQAILAR
jgi:hypothetical protein